MKKISNLSLITILTLIITFTTGCVNPELPSSIKTLEISSITSSTAKTGGTIENDGGVKITARGVCYSLVKNPTIANTITTDGTGVGNFTSSINELTPDTTYYVRAYATNSVGTAYGNEIIFKTLSGIIDIKTDPVTLITTNSATIGGKINSDGGTSIISSGICWDTSSEPTIQLATKTSNTTKSGAFQTLLTGLTPNTAYFIRSYATNSLGTTYGNEVSFATKTAIGSVFDIDGNAYTTVTLFGNQTWLAENLRTTKYRDGSNIPIVEDYTEWTALSTGACCNSENFVRNLVEFGKLYNWYAVTDSRNIAPVGWHIPSVDEWTILKNNYADALGFNALLGGSRGFDGFFSTTSGYGHWWLATSYSTTYAYEGYLFYNKLGIDIMTFDKRCGYSIRCVKDAPPFIKITNTGITTTTLSFNTNVISQDESNITTRGFCWSTSENPTINDNTTIVSTTQLNFTGIISRLLPNTTYYVRGFAYNTLGIGYSNQLKLKTYTGTTSDIDGNVYNTITIGTQVWMVENLKTTRYSNGESILNVTNNYTWANISNNTGAWCNYNNDASYGNKYGKLYNFFAVKDSRSIAPVGWHVPSYAEWATLINYLGGQSVAGGKLKEIGVVNWTSPNSGATNESEFSALPGGFRYNFDGTFKDVGKISYWWTTSFDVGSAYYYWHIDYNSSAIYLNSDWFYTGFSVRCIKD
ncbi:MAG: fibrobacter succinogenes major paralogous domain-containing protein [Paludibacter sp.]